MKSPFGRQLPMPGYKHQSLLQASKQMSNGKLIITTNSRVDATRLLKLLQLSDNNSMHWLGLSCEIDQLFIMGSIYWKITVNQKQSEGKFRHENWELQSAMKLHSNKTKDSSLLQFVHLLLVQCWEKSRFVKSNFLINNIIQAMSIE